MAMAILGALAMPAAPARASQADARDVARAANCPPGKIETVRQRVGTAAETVFKVNCTGGAKNQSVLVQCRSGQCVLLR
jgi:hypothetical protein